MNTHFLILSFILLTFISLTTATDEPECFIAGCHGQICTDNCTIWTTCEWADEFSCYQNIHNTLCERQSDGKCGWTPTEKLSECLNTIDNGNQPCYTGGCFNQICANSPHTSSSCNWIDQYSCYVNATCERQANRKCGWSSTSELQQCLSEATPSPAPCYVSGCFKQICSKDPNVWSLCEWKDEYVCYKEGICEHQSDGECGWTVTSEMEHCLSNPETDDCYIGGCSSELCTDDPSARSSCEWKEWYSCYGNATCERQSDGKCGWTSTDELDICLGDNKSDREKPCYVVGCSNEYCSDDLTFQNECGWRTWFSCYTNATCERQALGFCGWTSTPELEKCLEDTMPGPKPCYVAGCSSELCSDDANAQSDCVWKEWYSCYTNATCERQANGNCEWTLTPALDRCLRNDTSTQEPCYVGGCLKELCTDDPNAQSSCEWMAWYVCYRDAICERQIDGSCSWTETAELKDCLR